MRNHKTDFPSVDPSTYTKEYYLNECDGYEEFVTSGGRVLPKRLMLALSYAEIRPGMRVLDVGCGRGETLLWLEERGAKAYGVDYAKEALLLAKTTLRFAGKSDCCIIIAANAQRLPFADESFDLVLLLDVVEHLYSWELTQTLTEIWRVLKYSGWLIVHTAPNLWYYRFGYPIYRFIQRVRGLHLPKDPRDRFIYHRHVHVNEQSPTSLARALRCVGFHSHIWVTDIQERWRYEGFIVSVLGWIATRAWPIKLIFCNDIFCKAQKR